VGGAISQRELAVLRQSLNAGVPELGVGSLEHAFELPGIRWFCLESSDPDQIIECFHAMCLVSVAEAEVEAGLVQHPGDKTLIVFDTLLELGGRV